MQVIHQNSRFIRLGEGEMVYVAGGSPLPIFVANESLLQREGDLYRNEEDDASRPACYAFRDPASKEMTFLERSLPSAQKDVEGEGSGTTTSPSQPVSSPSPAFTYEGTAKHGNGSQGRRGDRHSSMEHQNIMTLQKDLTMLFEEVTASDTEVILQTASGEEVILNCHSCILSARSSVLKELLHAEVDKDEDDKRTSIKLTDYNEIVAREFIRYLYTARISIGTLELRSPLSSGSIEYLLTLSSLIQIAEAHDVFALSTSCEQLLKQSLYGTNLAEVLQVARGQDALSLQNVVLSLIESQIKDSVKAEVDAQKKRHNLIELLDANGMNSVSSKILSPEDAFLLDGDTTLEDSNESGEIDRSIRKSLFKEMVGPSSDLTSRRKLSSSEELSGYDEVSKSIKHSSEFRDLEDKLVDLVRAHPEGIMGCQVKPKFKERFERPLLLPQGISLKQVFLGIRNKGIHIQLTGFNKLPKYYYRHSSTPSFDNQMGGVSGGRSYSPVDALMADSAVSPESASGYNRSSASKGDYASSGAKSATPNICRFYQANRWCRYGSECRLLHDGRFNNPSQGGPVGTLRLGRAGDDSATPSSRSTPLSSGPSPSTTMPDMPMYRDRPYTPNFVSAATPQSRRSPTVPMMSQQSPANLLSQAQHNTQALHRSSHYSMDSMEEVGSSGQPQSSLWAPSSMVKSDRASPAMLFNSGPTNGGVEDVGLSMDGPGGGMIRSIFADVVENKYGGSGNNVGIGYTTQEMPDNGYDSNYLSFILGPSGALSPSKSPYEAGIAVDGSVDASMPMGIPEMHRTLGGDETDQNAHSYGGMYGQGGAEGNQAFASAAPLSNRSSLDFADRHRAYSHSSLDDVSGNGAVSSLHQPVHPAGNAW